MWRRNIQKCPWDCAALALAVAAPGAHAQQAALEKAAEAGDKLPSVIGFPAGYPVYEGPGDVLQKPVEVAAQDGDDFIIALAQAADINLICVAPRPLGKVQPRFTPRALVRLLELSRDCGLAWWRAGERTIVAWPEPDEERAARAWLGWFGEQRARDEASEAVSDEEAAQALEQLQVRDTPEARQQLRRDYVTFVRVRLQGQVRAEVLQYLEEHPPAPNAAEATVEGSPGDSLQGLAIAVRDLEPATRRKIEALVRVKARERWSPYNALWYSPQREEFWKQARLTLTPVRPLFPRRRMQLRGPDPTGALEEIWFTVGNYSPFDPGPDTTPPFQGQPAPRPAGGLRISGKRMRLREVLEAASQGSGLRIEAPLERLSEASLSLDVRGMPLSEFLAALGRALLVEWKVEGARVTAQERQDSESDRFFWQAGDTGLYHAGWRTGVDDRREEADLARAVTDQAGEQILAPQGVPVEKLSAEVQDGLRREAQEDLFNTILSDMSGILPASIEQGTLHLGSPLTRRGLLAVVPDAGRNPVAPGINLLLPEAQDQQIVPLDDGLVATLSATLDAPQEGDAKVEAVVRAYRLGREQETRQLRP